MSKRLWRFLSSDAVAPSSEIAAELVALERRHPQFQTAADEADAAALRVRQKRIAGVKLTDADADALARADEARADAEAGQAAVAELRGKLAEACEAERDKRCAELDRQIAEVQAKRDAAVAELRELVAQVAHCLYRIARTDGKLGGVLSPELVEIIPGCEGRGRWAEVPQDLKDRVGELVAGEAAQSLDRQIGTLSKPRRELAEAATDTLVTAALDAARGGAEA